MNAQDVNNLAGELVTWVESNRDSNSYKKAILKSISKQTIEIEGPFFQKLLALGWEHKLINTNFQNLCSIAKDYGKKSKCALPESVKFRLLMMKI